MASISTLGVGSGLDLSSILDSLEAAEKSTLTPISKQQSSYTAKLSAYGTLNNLTDQYNAASERIDTLMTRYKAQFTQLDVLMNSLNSTSSYLTQQFDTSNSNSK